MRGQIPLKESPVKSSAPYRLLFACLLVFGLAAIHPARAQEPVAASVVLPGSVLPTIAAMRSMPAPNGDAVVAVAGYAGPADGGGGSFLWDATDNADDDGGITINPAGHAGPGRWVRVLAQPGVVSPLFYGARCDGRGDDAPAINQAINYIREKRAISDLAPRIGVLQLPAEQCQIKTTINATDLGSASLDIIGTGGSFLCSTAGLPCFDAMGSGRLTLRDVTIYGNPRIVPKIGLQLGRISPRATAAGMYLDHVSISGYFSFAAFYNLNAETQLDVKLNASNQQPGGYGGVWDGYNHWRASSAFIPVTSPVDQLQSFGDNTCESCRVTSIGAGGIPMWAGGTGGLTFVNSYISNFNTGPAVVLYGYNINPNFDVHFEAGHLTNVFVFAGSGHPVLYGLIYREHDFFGQISMFGRDKGVRAVTLENVDISIGKIRGNGTWFDDPTKYTVSGRVAGMSTKGWVTPGGGFSGMACFGTKCFIQ
jgi:hypothetical protein